MIYAMTNEVAYSGKRGEQWDKFLPTHIRELLNGIAQDYILLMPDMDTEEAAKSAICTAIGAGTIIHLFNFYQYKRQ